MKAKVLLADDFKLFRIGFNAVAAELDYVTVVSEVSHGKDLHASLKKLKPDIAVVDLDMDGLEGLTTLEKLCRGYSKVKFLVVSALKGDSYIAKAMELGAAGYLDRKVAPDEIKQALQATAKEGLYLNEQTNKAMLQRLIKRRQVHPAFDIRKVRLSANEFDVLRYLCQELTSDEIAARMYLSKRTVEGIRLQLIHKTGCKNVVGLALFAAKHGIVELDEARIVA